jgi:pimeloyl-ACP methyl ester carboxylesterase
VNQSFANVISAVIFLCVSLSLGVTTAGDLPNYSEHQDLSYYLDSAGAKHPVKTKADWQVRRQHILAHMQTVMGPLPRPKTLVPLNLKTIEETKVGSLVRRKITYHTDSPERTVSAYLFLPPTDGKKFPAILCLHQTTKIGKMEPAGLGGKPNLRYALHLANRGYVTIAPDYPSFGDSDYDFDPKYGYISGTMKTIYDNIRAVDLLQSLEQVDGNRIGCIGHSLGGHNTMFTAAFEPRIKAMVSSCGFTRFHKYYQGRLKNWTSTRYMPLINSRYNNNPDEVPFDFTEIVASFAPRPFLASSPLHDSNFEVSGVRDTIAVAKPIYKLHGKPQNLKANYPDCAHDFPPNARKVAYEFFDEHLQHAPLSSE